MAHGSSDGAASCTRRPDAHRAQHPCKIGTFVVRDVATVERDVLLRHFWGCVHSLCHAHVGRHTHHPQCVVNALLAGVSQSAGSDSDNWTVNVIWPCRYVDCPVDLAVGIYIRHLARTWKAR
jgi:hypothetical protein